MQNANSRANHPSGDCSSIVTFQPDWHHELGSKLAVFPRSIPLAGDVFWPDLASFVEDHRSRQMAYYTLAPNAWSVQVAFYEHQGSWNLAVFNETCLAAQSSGSSLTTVSEELGRKLIEHWR